MKKPWTCFASEGLFHRVIESHIVRVRHPPVYLHVNIWHISRDRRVLEFVSPVNPCYLVFFFVGYSVSHGPDNNVPNASLLVSFINVSISESTSKRTYSQLPADFAKVSSSTITNKEESHHSSTWATRIRYRHLWSGEMNNRSTIFRSSDNAFIGPLLKTHDQNHH